jgi:transposase InsO family protein
LYPIKDVSAISAAEALIQFCGRFGYAHQLVIDRGSQFINEIITELLNILQIEHNLSISYSKEENSIFERCNKEVLRHLRAILLNPKITNWSVSLPMVQRIINASVNKSLGVSPAQLIYGNVINLNRNLLPIDDNTN